MGLKTKLDKLEQRAKRHHDDLLRLPDGTAPCYNIEKVLAAIDAAVCQEEHWLLAYLLEMDPETGLPDLIRALGTPQGLVEGGGD